MKAKVLPFLVLAAVSLSAVSCVYDDPEKTHPDCGRLLDVRSFDGLDAQINDVVVYIYDSDEKLVGYHPTSAAVPISIDQYTPLGRVKVVAWANTMGNKAAQSLSEPIIGSSLADHKLVQNLSGDSFASYPLTHKPSDIFYGAQDITFIKDTPGVYAKPKAVTTVLVNRAVASYTLTILHPGRAFENSTGNFQVVVKNPKNGLDFHGNPISGQSIYAPTTSYDATVDVLSSGIELAMITGQEGVIIEIYSDGQLVYTATVDRDDNILSLLPNKLSNIKIDLSLDAGVVLFVSSWDEVIIWQDFVD